MERHKTMQQMRLGVEDPMRFRFTRVSRQRTSVNVSEDLRLTRRSRDNFKTARIDVRIRAAAAKACGLKLGDYVEMTAGTGGVDGEQFFVRIIKTDEKAGMMLCHNQKQNSKDLRVTFTTSHEQADRFFGEKKVYFCKHDQRYEESVFFVTGGE